MNLQRGQIIQNQVPQLVSRIFIHKLDYFFFLNPHSWNIESIQRNVHRQRFKRRKKTFGQRYQGRKTKKTARNHFPNHHTLLSNPDIKLYLSGKKIKHITDREWEGKRKKKKESSAHMCKTTINKHCSVAALLNR